jgi:hypothetical protein
VTLSGQVMKAGADEVKQAYPVQAGYGRYRLSTTDPGSEAPQLLVDTATGGFYEIDLGDPQKRPTAMPELQVPKDQARVPPEGDALPPPPKVAGTKLFYDRIAPEDAAP